METLAFQGNKVFIAGDFSLIKIQFAPNLAAINPITNTLRWRPRAGNLQQENYFQGIQAIAADGDSLIWLYHLGTMRALDARTGFVVKRFELNTPGYPGDIKQIIPTSDRLYLQGQFQQIRGIAVTNGFAAITKDGGVFPWEPLFTNGTGQVNKAIIQGDHIYLGGRFTTFGGKKNLAIINRFTGLETSWKTDVANSIYGYEYEVKDFLLQGGELFTVGQDRGYATPGEYRKVSLSTGKVTATYSYTTCQASEQLIAKDKYIFINEGYCTPYERENVSYFDQSSRKFNNRPILNKYSILSPVNNQSQSYLPNPKDMTFVGGKLYYANYYANDPYGTVLPLPPLMTLNFPKGFFAETVEYFPKSGGNAGTVTVNFYGTNLAVGSKVRLTRAGQTPITVPDSAIKYPEAFRIEVAFDLRGKMVGVWNIEIITPTGESIIIPNGFTINQAKPADVQVLLNAPAAFRLGGPIRMTISVANRGDMDAYMVPVWIAVPNNVSVISPALSFQDDSLLKSDTIDLFDASRIAGKTFNGKLAWLAVGIIKAGQVAELKFSLINSNGGVISISVFTGQPLVQNNGEIISSGRTSKSFNLNAIDPGKVKCIETNLAPVIEEAIINNLVKNKPEQARECWRRSLETGAAWEHFKYDFSASHVYDLSRTVYQTVWHCGGNELTAKLPGNGKFINLIGKALAISLDVGEKLDYVEDAIKNCWPIIRPDPIKEQSAQLQPIRSYDPNDKLGPVGAKSECYVSAKDAFNYTIRFENYASATAAAQIVRVVDTLDRTKYDYSTFQLGFFNVADTTFYVPPGRKQYSVDWDLRPTKNLVLRMEARFNDTTGILTSTYTALDPLTMELTEDVFAGFLPPNRTAPEGEGSLAFSVRVKDELQNLTQVKNTAHIYFDYNDPIPTPVWTNTLDKGLPQSSMKPLPTVSSSTTVTLGWKGTDAESGPKLHDIFVSVNGYGYQPLLTATYDSTFQFVGKADSTYRFYSVAYDSVYNQELVPLTFDTETTIQINTAAIESHRSGNWNDPATWSCNCIPTASNDVVIAVGHTVLLDSTMVEAVCQNLEILGTFSMQGSSIIVNGVSIVIDQDNVITR